MLRAGSVSIIRRELPNGVIALCDPAEHFASASISCSLVGGSRDEDESNSGINHLLEHLLFKRTRQRSTDEIAEQIDLFGGDVNAYTDPESITLHGTVPAEQSTALLHFLADLICNPQFLESDVQIEKEIVLQEIADLEDSVEEQTYQRFRAAFWKNCSLGLPITGTGSSLLHISYDDLQRHLESIRCGKRLVVAGAGAIEPEVFFAEVGRVFGGLPRGAQVERIEASPQSGVLMEALPSAQSYLIIGKPFPGSADKRYLESVVFSSILGHGSSSVLFQAMREREAICYDIDSSVEAYSDQSALLISCSSQSGDILRALNVMRDEIESFFASDRVEHLLNVNRQMILAQLKMEDDSIRARQWRAVETEISVGRYIPAEEIADRMKEITADSLRAFAKEHFFIKNSLLVIGGSLADNDEVTLRAAWPY